MAKSRPAVQVGLDFVLAADVVGGDHGAEAEGTASENDVLHRRIDAGAADAVGIGEFVLPVLGYRRR
jgi:hypothetical protein